MSKISDLIKVEWVRFLLCSLFLSLVLCIVFSAFVKGLFLDANVVNAGRTVIKLTSILAGALFGVKRAEKGAIKGLIWGVGYALVSFVLFSILSGRLDFGQFSLVDTAFCALAGIISGIIAVNVKK